MKINLLILCLLLLSCNEPQKTAKPQKTDWVKEEILTQLAELRKEVKSLKADIAQLDSKIGNARAAARPSGPTKVKLDFENGLGNASAKLAIVEFTDYQCPYCGRHAKNVFPQIKQKLIDTGKVKYVSYDYPLGFHPQAKPASIAARCAGKQGKYWEMHDALFENQSSLGTELYTSSAKKLGLDPAAFGDCLSNTEVAKQVDSDFSYGSQIGVTGTPKFYVGKVNGDEITDVIVISGAQPMSAFNNALTKLGLN